MKILVTNDAGGKIEIDNVHSQKFGKYRGFRIELLPDKKEFMGASHLDTCYIWGKGNKNFQGLRKSRFFINDLNIQPWMNEDLIHYKMNQKGHFINGQFIHENDQFEKNEFGWDEFCSKWLTWIWIFIILSPFVWMCLKEKI